MGTDVEVREAVRVEGVSKVFTRGDDELRVLADVDLRIHAGEFVSIVGPSGCGKSTLLRMIAGLTEQTTGVVAIGDRPIQGPPPEVGLMLQSPTLLPWRNVLANVLLPIQLEHAIGDADRARARELLDLVGLTGFERHYPKELSGGMQQRVALCRLLIAEPEIMLLDEPFGALDELTRERLNLELADIVARTNRTVLLVTHNVTEAVFLADRVVPMTAGPGTCGEVVTVPLERPRKTSVLGSTEFVQAVFKVRRALGIEDAP